MENKSTGDVSELAGMAAEVRDDLAGAGLPALMAGSANEQPRSRGVPGAIVYYNAASDESAGVYVIWFGAPDIVDTVTSALMNGTVAQARGRASLGFLAAVDEAMNDALVAILAARGWKAELTDIGGTNEILVRRPESAF